MASFLFAVKYAENVNYFLQGGSRLISVSYHKVDKWCRFSGVLLAAFWVCGLLFGASAARLSQYHIVSLMQQLFEKPLSIVGLLVSILFSMLITALAVILSNPDLFYIAAVVRAFALSYWLACLMLSGGPAKALVACFLAPTAMVSATSLLCFWIQNIPKFRSDYIAGFLRCIAVQCAVGFVQILFTGVV